MRALVCHQFGDYHDLGVENITEPQLLPRGVRIAVEFASLSFSISLWISGKYQVRPPLPFVPGAEVVGRVLETAPGVIRYHPGQRVLALTGWGGYAEQVVCHESTVYPLPDGIDSAAALHLGVSYCTAYCGLVWRARLKANETLLVLAAAGGVGLAAVEVGRAIGAFVIAAAGDKEKCELAVKHGANAKIDYRNEDLHSRIKDLDPRSGLDVVFDPVGGEVSETALRCLRPGGRLISIGFASGSMPKIQANVLLVKNISVIGFNFGTYIGWSAVDEREHYEPQVRPVVEQLFQWYEQGRIRPVVGKVYPLEQFAMAQDALLGRNTTGKIVLRIEN